MKIFPTITIPNHHHMPSKISFGPKNYPTCTKIIIQAEVCVISTPTTTITVCHPLTICPSHHSPDRYYSFADHGLISQMYSDIG